MTASDPEDILQSLPDKALGDLAAFLSELSARGSSPHTMRAYRNDLVQMIGFLLTEMPHFDPAEVTTLHLRKFLAYLREQGVSRRTVARKIAAMRSRYSSPASFLAPLVPLNLAGFATASLSLSVSRRVNRFGMTSPAVRLSQT